MHVRRTKNLIHVLFRNIRATFASFASDNSFTLIELLIVIGILAVLVAAVVIALNPAQLLAQARDGKRQQDLSALTQALNTIYALDQSVSFGSSSVVYTSLPDSTTTCANWHLPSLPSGWIYNCVSTSSLQSATGTGWIPVNFTTTGVVSLASLPLDPINTSSTGLYYTYVSGGSFELNGILESTKYRNNTALSKPNLPGVLSYGSNQSLSPLYNTSGLVGYWPFDEGSGTTTKDMSGNGNNGTLVNGPIWVTRGGGGALSFNGVNSGVQKTSDSDVLDIGLGSMSWGMWFNTSTSTSEILYRKSDAGNANGIIISINSTVSKVRFWVSSVVVDSLLGSYNDGNWHYVVGVLNRSDNTMKIYMDGTSINSVDATLLSGVNLNATGGIYLCGSAPQFAGFLDDVRIYNRALSASEVSALYNATK